MESSLPSLTSSTPHIAVEVILVGVVGCSASGKSTAAHQLARVLHSPLHPISTDHFFLDNVCADLGTYDDYRCLDYAKIAHWMKVLKQSVRSLCATPLERHLGKATFLSEAERANALDSWCVGVLARLPELSAYLHASAPQVSSQIKEDGRKVGFDAPSVDSRLGDLEDDDASLCAHEAEDDARRSTSDACPVSPIPTTSSNLCGDVAQGIAESNVDCASRSKAEPRHLTVYVVWEGFTLLCDGLVNAFIDVAVHVRCDPETACLRRFFRSPRRHLVQHVIQPADDSPCEDGKESGQGEEFGEQQQQQRQDRSAVVARVVRQLYRPRIEQMWAVRARESQRVALYHDLLQAMTEQEHTLRAVGDASHAENDTQWVKSLLSRELFNPPRPSAMHKDTKMRRAEEFPSECGRTCWTSEGIPTRSFQHFWEEEFEQWLVDGASRRERAALSWAALGANGRENHLPPRTVPAVRLDPLCTDQIERLSPSPVMSEGCCARCQTSHTDGSAQSLTNVTGKAYVDRVLAERGMQALGQEPSHLQGKSSVRATELATALAPFYYEFRYWFFFEVLFFDQLVCPLQSQHLRMRDSPGVSGSPAAVRQWWVLENGRMCQGKMEDELLRQVREIAFSILSSSSSNSKMAVRAVGVS